MAVDEQLAPLVSAIARGLRLELDLEHFSRSGFDFSSAMKRFKHCVNPALKKSFPKLRVFSQLVGAGADLGDVKAKAIRGLVHSKTQLGLLDGSLGYFARFESTSLNISKISIHSSPVP